MTDDTDFDIDLDRRTIMKLGAGAAAVATTGLGFAGETALAREAASTPAPALGAPVWRAEGPLKVAGQARYAIEQKLENMAYGVTVQSTRAAGRIVSIETSAAKALPGVIDVYTHQNSLKINKPTFYGSAELTRVLKVSKDLKHIICSITISYAVAIGPRDATSNRPLAICLPNRAGCRSESERQGHGRASDASPPIHGCLARLSALA